MLKQRALSATLWSAIEQIGTRGLGTIFMLIFARHLSAEDFGIFSAATLAIGFASTVAQFGLNTIVVQRQELNRSALSTAFWMALGASLVMAGLLTALANPLAKLFGNLDIAPLVPVLAGGMVVSTASAMVTALLRRELNMKALARRSLLANAISGAIATPFILAGFGAWGLVVQTVGGAILTLILTLLLIGLPVQWAFDRKVAFEMLRFGAPVFGNDLLKQYSNASPQLFVGVVLGPQALGIFAMAMRVAQLFMTLIGSTLTNVAFPVLAEVVRQSPERVREIYLRLVHVTYAGLVLLFALAITLRDPMISVMLGNNWHETVPVVLYLLLAGLVMNTNYINSAVLLARGSPGAVFLFSALRALVGTILLLIATPFGLVAASIAYVSRSIIVDTIQLIYLLMKLEINFIDYWRRVKGALFSGLALFGTGFFMIEFSAAYSPLIVLILSGSVALAAYLLTLFVVDKRLIIELQGLSGRKGGGSR